MKIFKFIISKIFLRKPIVSVGIILLLCMTNGIAFTAVRSIFSTVQGYRETKDMNQEGNFIANLDPNEPIDMDAIIRENRTQTVYDYLNKNFDYALYTGGFAASLPNNDNMEISLYYMNQEYYRRAQFELSQGTGLDFDYPVDEEIPVLIGKGVSKTYPIGSTIRIEESVLGRPITLKVQGILKPNAYHSNYYALSSKTYYNFSILVPVNAEFIVQSNIDLQWNGLMDLTVLGTTREQAAKLSDVMEDTLGTKFNFFEQQENYDYFNEYYLHALEMIALTTLTMIIIITFISVWNAFVGVRLMQKDFTINLLVGLSYSRLRKIFYGYFGILSFLTLMVIFAKTAFDRYGC